MLIITAVTLLDLYRHDGDDRWEPAGVATAAHEFEVATDLALLPGAPAGEDQQLIGEQGLDKHAVHLALVEAEQGRGLGVGMDDPAL